MVGQQAEVERLGTSLNSLYLPLKTSDLLLIEYRKWLDKFGTSLPFYQGYSTRKLPQKELENNQQPAPLDRLRRHTQICGSCNRAYQVTNRLKTTFVAVAIALAALAIVTDGSGTELLAILGSGSAVVIATVAHKVKTHFERSYTRH